MSRAWRTGRTWTQPCSGRERRIRCGRISRSRSDPSEYAGGELALQTSFGEHEVKLPAGSAVVYPATTLHQARPVTRGVRLVAVTWVQSWVRDPAAREILADISRAAAAVQRNSPGSEESLLLSRAYANLLRRESEG